MHRCLLAWPCCEENRDTKEGETERVKGKKKNRSIKEMKGSSLSQRAIVSPMWHNKELKTLSVTLETRSNAWSKGHTLFQWWLYTIKKCTVVKTNPLSNSFCESLLSGRRSQSLLISTVAFTLVICVNVVCLPTVWVTVMTLFIWHTMYYHIALRFSLIVGLNEAFLFWVNAQMIKFKISFQSSSAGFNKICVYTGFLKEMA